MNKFFTLWACGATVALLTACASPSPEYMRAPRQELVVGPHEITVFYLPDRAQAVRTSFAGKAEKKTAIAAMVVAIEQVSRCKVRRNSVKGDVSLINVRLKC